MSLRVTVRIYFFSLFVIPCAAFAQGNLPLKAKEKIPDAVIESIVRNIEGLEANELEGKLILIQFWNTTCGTSLATLPMMETLQDEFGDQIKVILINNLESKEAVEEVFKNKGLELSDLPAGYSMSELADLFPSGEAPYHVWIDEDWNLIARTKWFYATPETVQRLLNKEDLQMVELVVKPEVDKSKPLLKANEEVLQREPLFYSAITRTHKSSSGGIVNRNGNKLFANYSIEGLYAEAFDIPIPLIKTRIIYEVSDSLRRIISGPLRGTSVESINAYLTWDKNHSYCYTVNLDPEQLPTGWRRQIDFKRMMLDDLNDYFGVTLGIGGVKEKRVVECFYLKKDIEGVMAGSPAETKFGRFPKLFASYLERKLSGSGMPVVVDPSITEDISIALENVDEGIEEMKSYLRSNGYILSERQEEVEVLVIKEVIKQ